MEQNNNDRFIAAVDPSVKASLDRVEEYSTLPSTNSYLLQQPAPKPGHAHVAMADQQTEGRGQRGNDWYSPPLAGLYLSVSYTMTQKPENFSCLTLAAGSTSHFLFDPAVGLMNRGIGDLLIVRCSWWVVPDLQ